MKEREETRRPRLEIDPLKLEDELQEHPSQYGYWADSAVEAQADYDDQKFVVEKLRAKLDSEMRSNPDAFGISKLTESAIANEILCDPQYIGQVEILNERKRRLGLAKAAVDSLEHRKKSLSLLVELWIRDYYSSESRSIGPSRLPEMTEAEKRAARSRGQSRMRESVEERNHDNPSD